MEEVLIMETYDISKMAEEEFPGIAHPTKVQLALSVDKNTTLNLPEPWGEAENPCGFEKWQKLQLVRGMVISDFTTPPLN